MGDVGSICMCKRILKSQTNTVSGVPFYKIGTFGKEADAYISKETYDEYRSRYNFPKKGDVLISAAGTIGRTVVYDGKPAYFQDSNIVWIDNDESIVLNSYLRYCYELKPWKASEGGTIPRLYNDNIAKAVICLLYTSHVAMGLPLWEYEVHQGTVLYLALEDDYARLQRRLFRMFGVEETSNLYFATQAKSVSEGLDQQLEGFIREHPDVRLIIIDTLQKVREIGGDRYSYASDYEIVTKLKTFSDRYGICLLVVHLSLIHICTTDVTGIITLPEGTEMCMPGDNVMMHVELLTPVAMEEGLRFAIREGGRTVGSGVVGKIIE